MSILFFSPMYYIISPFHSVYNIFKPIFITKVLYLKQHPAIAYTKVLFLTPATSVLKLSCGFVATIIQKKF